MTLGEETAGDSELGRVGDLATAGELKDLGGGDFAPASAVAFPALSARSGEGEDLWGANMNMIRDIGL